MSVDIAKSICMIWIIAFWHLGPRMGYDMNSNPVYGILTDIALAAFTFYSGLFLGKKDVSAKEFFKKRFVRFYPLFAFVCIMMYMSHSGIKSLSHLACALTGLSVFVGPHTPVLWYMDMLLVLYLLTPVFVPRRGVSFGRPGG